MKCDTRDTGVTPVVLRCAATKETRDGKNRTNFFNFVSYYISLFLSHLPLSFAFSFKILRESTIWSGSSLKIAEGKREFFL